jgi:hypothetical protein
MDNITLKKKLSAYVSDKGYLTGVTDEIRYEVLCAWENWTGTGTEFYRSLGFSQKQMAGLLGKAKKLKREGHFWSPEFKQVKVDLPPESALMSAPGSYAAAEIVWHNGQVIRFSAVDQLLDFLKRSA